MAPSSENQTTTANPNADISNATSRNSPARIVDESQAECWVLTYKEGLLSPIAHDLKLRVGRWRAEMDVSAKTVVARLDSRSLRVVCAVKQENGKKIDDIHALSDKDKKKVEESIVRDVLHSQLWPEIVFKSQQATASADGNGYKVTGVLSLHGHDRSVEMLLHKQNEAGKEYWMGELNIHQPNFGITPYSAAFGTLKVRADVKIQIRIPAALVVV